MIGQIPSNKQFCGRGGEWDGRKRLKSNTEKEEAMRDLAATKAQEGAERRESGMAG
jgi:hypothetical protein